MISSEHVFEQNGRLQRLQNSGYGVSKGFKQLRHTTVESCNGPDGQAVSSKTTKNHTLIEMKYQKQKPHM